MRVIVIAQTKRAGADVAQALGVEPVAIVTPRTQAAAAGIVADQIVEAPGLTHDARALLRPLVEACLQAARGIDMVAATEKALEAASRNLTDADAGAVEALRALARKIDAWDQIVEWALDDASETRGARPAVPQNDNVSISAYLKYCDQLGLSPAGRKALGVRDGGVSGKKAKLTALRGGKSA